MTVLRWIALVLLFTQLVSIEAGLLLALDRGTRPDALVFVNGLQGLLPLAYTIVLWLFASRRKSLILFLRHFKDDAANRLLSESIYGALRSIARLVVLDDSEFKPTSVPIRERIVVAGLLLIIGITIAGVVAIGSATTTQIDRSGPGYHYQIAGFVSVVIPAEFGLSSIAIGAPGSFQRTVTENVRGQVQRTVVSQGTFSVNTAPPEFFTAPENKERVVGSISQSIPLWSLILFLGYFAYRIAFRSWETKCAISSTEEIAPLVRRLSTLRSRWRAPRSLGALSTVVRPKDEQWQSVVKAFVDKADWVILDCSHPTESIVWELQLALRKASEKLIITRNRDRDTGSNIGTDYDYQVRSLLADHPENRVFEYGIDFSERSLQKHIAKLIKGK
jgi:hypothetical protein